MPESRSEKSDWRERKEENQTRQDQRSKASLLLPHQIVGVLVPDDAPCRGGPLDVLESALALIKTRNAVY